MEFGSESEAEEEIEASLETIEEYQLPQLKPPSSYAECQDALRTIDSKVQHALSSPSRARYQVTIESTNIFLARGSLYEIEIAQAYAGAKATHKRKLIARKSLGRGGSLLARDALQKIKDKRRQEADNKYVRQRELLYSRKTRLGMNYILEGFKLVKKRRHVLCISNNNNLLVLKFPL